MYKLLIIILIAIIFIYVFNQLITYDFMDHTFIIKTSIPVITVPTHMQNNYISNKTSAHKILLWTKYFSSDDWLIRDLKELKCKFSNCILTKDRDEIDISDVILFHWRDINVNDLPVYHSSSQIWVLFNWESPFNSPIRKLQPLVNHINWTMSYRYDSDVFVPYGKVVKCSSMWKPINKFKDKKKSIAWMVSSCNTNSKRELYVKELRTYIDVDIYGGCGDFICKHDSGCYQMIAKNYKFYLSFENSLCKDYVTEKLFRIIGYDIIPIVFGSADYKQIMPFNSYIDVFNFSTPKRLADFLKTVSNDENVYNSYFEWKNNYCARETNYTYFCDLCEKLNNLSNNKNQNNTDLINWWYKQANCIENVKIF